MPAARPRPAQGLTEERGEEGVPAVVMGAAQGLQSGSSIQLASF